MLKQLATTLLLTLSFTGIVRADPLADTQASIDKGLTYLKAQQQPTGAWGDDKTPPAITALVLNAFVNEPAYPYSTDFVKKGYAYLLSIQKPEGGVYVDLLANYNTAIVISALSPVSSQPEVKKAMDNAVAYLRTLQWTESTVGPKGETIKEEGKQVFEGGFGYGRNSRPDLSNTQFGVQALHDAGLKPEDPAFQTALKFISRTQNRSESNDQKWASNDGGFVYTPARGGESEAKDFKDEAGERRLRSYGSMTYAGLKSMIYAGLTKDDPRVKAAYEWLKKNYTLDENPGMRAADPANAQHGLYYYYLMMARALDAYNEPTITDEKGNSHDWRIELLNKLKSLQKEDGSWTGDQRWMENNPVLVTAYVTLALQSIEKDLKENPVK